MKQFLSRNLTPKLLAVLVALIVWIFVMNEQNPPSEGSFQVQLARRNTAENVMVTEAPETVRIKVRALRNALAGVAGKDFRAAVDLDDLAAGQHNLPVTVQLPPGFELLEINPDKVRVKLEAMRTRQLAVEVRLIGPSAADLLIDKATLQPAAVTVSGPRSLVDSIAKAVISVQAKNGTGDFRAEGRVVLLGQDGKEIKGLHPDPAQVAVTGLLQPGTLTKQIEVKTVLTGNLPEGFVLRKVFTEPAKVEMKGPKDLLDKLDAVYTEPILLTGINKDTTKEVALQLKEGISVPRKTVMVRITVGQGR